jgi:hypothetical protein
MRRTPDRIQPPQASASTNSATRAFSCQPDGVSQEIGAASSVAAARDKFNAPGKGQGSRGSSARNQIRRSLNPRERFPLFIHEVDREMVRLDAICGAGRARHGWVYAIRQCTGSRLIKIGRAEDPRKRLADIQSMNASALELVGLSHGAELEPDLHWEHRSWRAHGEWFDLDANPIPSSPRGCWCCAGSSPATSRASAIAT